MSWTMYYGPLFVKWRKGYRFWFNVKEQYSWFSRKLRSYFRFSVYRVLISNWKYKYIDAPRWRKVK